MEEVIFYCSNKVYRMDERHWRSIGQDLATVLSVMVSNGRMSFDRIVREVSQIQTRLSETPEQMPLYRLMQSLTTLVAMHYVEAEVG